MPEKEDPIVTTLRDHRLRAGLSIPALAEKAGVNTSTLRAAETGKHAVTLRTLRPWAAVLGLSLQFVSLNEDDDDLWLIWSVRQHGWYVGTDAVTGDLWRARRFFDRDDVTATLVELGRHDFGTIPSAVAVAAPESGKGRLTVAEITDAPALMTRRVADRVSAHLANLTQAGRTR